jgi:hypothetical protein
MLEGADDAGYVLLKNVVVAAAFSQMTPTKQVELTPLLAQGSNPIMVSVHNVWVGSADARGRPSSITVGGLQPPATKTAGNKTLRGFLLPDGRLAGSPVRLGECRLDADRTPNCVQLRRRADFCAPRPPRGAVLNVPVGHRR